MEKLSLDLTILMPAFNEEEIIPEVVTKVQEIMAPLDYQYEILVVDDGSADFNC